MTNSSPRPSRNSSSVVSFLAAMIATILAIVGAVTGFLVEKQESSQLLAVKELMDLRSALDSNEKRIRVIEEQFRAAVETSQIQKGEPNTSVLLDDVSQLRDRMKKIENWVVLEPEQAVAIPLLKKEIQELNSSMNSHRNNTSREIDRIYTIGQWFIGTLIAVIVALVAPFIGNLITSRKQRSEEPRNHTPPEAT